MLETFLAKPFIKLAYWASTPYSGEWRNGCAAHVMAGWALTLTLTTLVFKTPLNRGVLEILGAFLIASPALYGIFREVQDAKYKLSNWNRKSWSDILTWEIGCIIGGTCYILLNSF